MRDSVTGLYHHGWDVANSTGNGQFWARGTGWYAMALVDTIEMLPDEWSSAKTALKERLKERVKRNKALRLIAYKVYNQIKK